MIKLTKGMKQWKETDKELITILEELEGPALALIDNMAGRTEKESDLL